MNKLLREVPTMESWISGGSSEFVQVSLHQDFIKAALDDLKVSVDNWLKEPIECCQNIGKKTCNVLTISTIISYFQTAIQLKLFLFSFFSK